MKKRDKKNKVSWQQWNKENTIIISSFCDSEWSWSSSSFAFVNLRRGAVVHWYETNHHLSRLGSVYPFHFEFFFFFFFFFQITFDPLFLTLLLGNSGNKAAGDRNVSLLRTTKKRISDKEIPFATTNHTNMFPLVSLKETKNFKLKWLRDLFSNCVVLVFLNCRAPLENYYSSFCSFFSFFYQNESPTTHRWLHTHSCSLIYFGINY